VGDITVTAPVRISAGRKLAIGVGDFGCNLYWQMTQLYLLFFYTDVVGLPAQTAGLIYMIALIWDAAMDPVVGLIADRTRSRWGRYRPYLVLGGPLLAPAFVVLFVGPSAQTVGAAAFALISQLVFRTLYAVVAIPYASLFARVTTDSAQRGDLTGFRMVCGALAAIIVATLTLPLATALGGGAEGRQGWVILGAAYGVVATGCLLLTAWGSRGLDTANEVPAPRRPFDEAWRSLSSNRALHLLLAAIVISSFSTTMFSKNLLYYFKYIVGDAGLGSMALGVMALTIVLTTPLWAVALRLIGKRNSWLFGAVPTVAGLVLWHMVDGQSLTLLFTALGLQAIGAAAYVVCFWSMLPDTVEYGEWRSGVRTESLVFGLTVLGQKVALGLGAGVLGMALTRFGYVPNVAQSPQTLSDIKNLMFWAPLAGTLLSAGLIWFYPINRRTHAEMVDDIAARAAPSRAG
jgi:GPH family glycoside/pentoside/hexuronide:cation symporter